MADQSQSQTPLTTPDLDLGTLITRPVVRINGIAYEMRSQDEVSELEYRRIERLGLQAEEIEKLEDPTDLHVERYEQLLREIARRVLLVPPDVLKTLRVRQLVAVSVTFSKLRMASLAASAGALQNALIAMGTPHQARAGQSTGATSSPA
jgi:hypothetical protein